STRSSRQCSARRAPTRRATAEIASPSGPRLARWEVACSGPPRLVRFGVDIRRNGIRLCAAYSVEKIYLLARAKNLRALQATETTRHEGALPEGAHVSPRSCVGLGACRERIESLECTRQRNHVVADLVFFNRIGQELPLGVAAQVSRERTLAIHAKSSIHSGRSIRRTCGLDSNEPPIIRRLYRDLRNSVIAS